MREAVKLVEKLIGTLELWVRSIISVAGDTVNRIHTVRVGILNNMDTDK